VRARISPCRDWSCSRIVSTRIHFLIVGRGIARIVTLQRGARAPKLLHRPQREVRRGTYEFCASGIEGSLSLSLYLSLSIYLSICLSSEANCRIQWHRERSSFSFGYLEETVVAERFRDAFAETQTPSRIYQRICSRLNLEIGEIVAESRASRTKILLGDR
jgi:hypothetical protein